MPGISSNVIVKGLDVADNGVDNQTLADINAALRNHSVELIGAKPRVYMAGTNAIVSFS